jgi:2-succinyl-6-hydroxy-2,4-cyclohexadiene-1-carboxylate synthase
MMDRRIRVNGVQLGVVLRGEATKGQRTLVLLHGFTGSAAAWGSHLDTLAASGMRIVAFDLLGHGQSDAPANPQRYAMEHCQADILAALDKLVGARDVTSSINRIADVPRHIGRNRCASTKSALYSLRSESEAILLGYSLGGRIALYTAFSGFFRALILESASPGLASPIEREERRISDEILAASIERDGVAAFVDRWEKLPLFASQQSLPAACQQTLHAQRLHNCAVGLANSLRGVGVGVQPALHARLPALSIPVMLIAGELDNKFCALARQMAQVLPQSQLHIVPGAGHAVHLDRPREFDDLVRDFSISVS